MESGLTTHQLSEELDQQRGSRHTYITFQLTLNETPVAIVAAQCDTSIKYIEEHYFHYRAELSTQTLAKGRNTLKAATGDLEWLQVRPTEKQT